MPASVAGRSQQVGVLALQRQVARSEDGCALAAADGLGHPVVVAVTVRHRCKLERGISGPGVAATPGDEPVPTGFTGVRSLAARDVLQERIGGKGDCLHGFGGRARLGVSGGRHRVVAGWRNGAAAGPRPGGPEPASPGPHGRPQATHIRARLPVRCGERGRRPADHRRSPRRSQHAHDGGRPARGAGGRNPGGHAQRGHPQVRALPGSPALASVGLHALRAPPCRDRRRACARPQDRLLSRRPIRADLQEPAGESAAEGVYDAAAGST